MSQCEGITKAGYRCKLPRSTGERFCHHHVPAHITKSESSEALVHKGPIKLSEVEGLEEFHIELSQKKGEQIIKLTENSFGVVVDLKGREAFQSNLKLLYSPTPHNIDPHYINHLMQSATDSEKLELVQEIFTPLLQKTYENNPLLQTKYIELHLFSLGFLSDVNLQKVRKLLNVSPDAIRPTLRDCIQDIGAPALYGIAYSDRQLADLLPTCPDNAYKVGIVLAPIEGNFFTRVYENCFFISLYQCEELCQASRQTKEEYIAQAIVTDLLFHQYLGRTLDVLYHEDTRGCIFDFTAHKSNKVYKLQASRIDSICKRKLVEANVPDDIIRSVEKVLERIRRPTLFDTLSSSLNKPLFSFIFGGLCVSLLVNILTSFILGDFDSRTDIYILSGLLVLIVLTIIGNHLWTMHRGKTVDSV